MAFRKDKTGAAQTAANAAATLVSAFAESFDDFDAAIAAYHDLRSDIFDDLGEVVDADNEVFAAAEKADGGSKSSGRSNKRSSGSGSKRNTRKTGGRRGGGSGFKGDLDDALNMKLKFGAFEGETLQTVLEADVDTCDDDYGYGDGERDGRDYISWLAGDSNENDFVRTAARLVADEEGIEYDG